MCTHRSPGDVEDCILTPDRVTGGLVCVQHGPPIPRQRDDELDVIVPTIQADVVDLLERSSLGTPDAKRLRESVSPENARRVVERAEALRRGDVR